MPFLLFSLMLIVVGLDFIFSENKVVLRYSTVDVSSNHIGFTLVGIFFILSAIYLFFRTIQMSSKENKLDKLIETSKCPSCKEVYAFHRLDKGICPGCNVETIDVDVYFKVNKDDELST